MGTRHAPLSIGSFASLMQLQKFQKCETFMQVVCEWHVSLLLWLQSLVTSAFLINLQNLDILWTACFWLCHTCLWAKGKQFRSQISVTTNKLCNKFHLFTCIVDYSNLFCLFLIAKTCRSSLLYVDKWNLLYSVTYLCVSILWVMYIIKISVTFMYSE